MTPDERFKALAEGQRHLQRLLMFNSYLIILIFVIVVIGPILRQFGLWNILGFGE